MENHNWTLEAEEKERKARRIAIVIIAVVALGFFAIFGTVIVMLAGTFKLVNEQVAEGMVPGITTAPVKESELEPPRTLEEKRVDMLQEKLDGIAEKERLTEHLGTAYEVVYEVTADCASCVAKKEGKWGMVTMTGDVLVPFKYDRVTCMDNTGWVEFQKGTTYTVYDETGKMVRMYEDKFEDLLESEEAYLYRTAEANMSGMIVRTILPENPEQDYYGVEYYNRTSGELLYRAIGGADEVGLFTFPDAEGRAVAIQNHSTYATVYYITKDGCERREIYPETGVNYRWFSLPGQYSWADIAFRDGWLKVDVTDAVPGFLIDDYKYYTAFLNVDTLELVSFPEEYQEEFWLYNAGRGNTMAIASSAEQTGGYSICKGSEKLTEECYYWASFEDSYIIACGEEWVEILDYDGKLRAKYVDVCGRFVNGKMLVYDGAGVYLINEQLEKCSGYLIEGQIDCCFSRGVVIDGWYYFVPEFAQ